MGLLCSRKKISAVIQGFYPFCISVLKSVLQSHHKGGRRSRKEKREGWEEGRKQ